MLTSVSIVSISQTSLSWKKANFAKTDNMAGRAFQDDEGYPYVLFYEATAFQVIKGVSFNKFSSDLQFDSRIPIEGTGSKDYLSTFVVGDFVCMAELKMPSPKSKSNYAMFYNVKGELVKKVEVDAEYNIESIKLSKDENTIIIYALNKVPTPNSKIDKDYLVKVMAYDKHFEKIAEESFKFEDVFTSASEVSSLSFDITKDKKIVAMSTNQKKMKTAQLNLAIFKNTGEKPTVYKYSFEDDGVNFEYNFGKENEIYISGTLASSGPFSKSADKVLFFINQPLESDKAAKPVIYEISKQLYVSYPECKKVLSANKIDPFEIFTMSDGVLYGSMKVIVSTTYSSNVNGGSSSSKTRYYSNAFVFIKFSFSGEIQWLKVINKELYCTESYSEMANFAYKQDGDKLRVIYNDNPANIINKSTKLVRASIKKCVPALGEISSNGDITTKPLDKLGKNNCFNYPAKSMIKDGSIILVSFKPKSFSRPDVYIGKVALPE